MQRKGVRMKIMSFEFENKWLEWRLEKLSFDKFTLLVGASGVGKTQILRTLIQLGMLAEGQSIGDIKWNIEFETLDKKRFIWEGETEQTKYSISLFEEFVPEKELKKHKFKVISEKLFLNEKLLAERNKSTIFFNGNYTVKLSQYESIISLLREENLIKPAYKAFRELYFTDYTQSPYMGILGLGNAFDKTSAQKKYGTLEKIRESELPVILKLLFLSVFDKQNFDIIKQQFIDVFPYVEDIRIELIERQLKKNTKIGNLSFIIGQHYNIEIKEKGVKKWIPQERISSGMLRTLMQISELYLCAEGTVFLIDEFENSLGINCINEITNQILHSDRQLQFIITSHHPYIIDAIDYKNWKLVTRNGSVIKAHSVDKFNIGKSKHSAFMQLLQLQEYQTGQEKI